MPYFIMQIIRIKERRELRGTSQLRKEFSARDRRRETKRK